MFVSTGTVNGVSRTVKAEAKGYPPAGHYAIYTLNNISVWKGASALITGDVGTNGQYHYTADPTINGGVYFNGPALDGRAGTPEFTPNSSRLKPIVYPHRRRDREQSVSTWRPHWLGDSGQQ